MKDPQHKTNIMDLILYLCLDLFDPCRSSCFSHSFCSSCSPCSSFCFFIDLDFFHFPLKIRSKKSSSWSSSSTTKPSPTGEGHPLLWIDSLISPCQLFSQLLHPSLLAFPLVMLHDLHFLHIIF